MPGPARRPAPAGGAARARDMPGVRGRMLRWLRAPGAGDDLARGARVRPPGVPDGDHDALAAWEHTHLAGAALYWASPELSALAVHAARSLPALRLHPEMIPSRSGLLAWADPVEGDDGRHVAAVSWRVLGHPPAVWIDLWTDARRAAAASAAARGGDPRAAAEWAAARFGRLGPDAEGLLPLDVELEWTDPGVARALGVTVHGHERPAPSERRRLARAGAPTDGVTYVALRRQATDAGQRAAAEGHGHRHRWWVRGHWRRQWYPSADAQRPIWIDPHLKGPAGAPLLHRETVYTLRR